MPTDSAFDPTINLCIGDLTFHSNHANRLLKSSTTDPFRQEDTLPLFKNEAHTKLCHNQALRTNISKRMDKLPILQDKKCPLFLTKDNTIFSNNLYTTNTDFSTKYLMMCKVYTDVGGIK